MLARGPTAERILRNDAGPRGTVPTCGYERVGHETWQGGEKVTERVRVATGWHYSFEGVLFAGRKNFSSWSKR